MKITLNAFLGRLKRICLLGLNQEQFVIHVTPEIRKIIPAYSSSFLWVDENYNYKNFYDESPDSIQHINDYFKFFLDKKDNETRPSLRNWLKQIKDSSVTNSAYFFFRKYKNTEFYNEILRPMKYGHELIIGLKPQGSPLGILFLHRSIKEQPFSIKDERNMVQILPALTRGLHVSQTARHELMESENTGIALFNLSGHLHYYNESAKRYAFLSSIDLINASTYLKHSVFAHVGDKITRYISLVKDGVTRDEKFSLTNRWGTFCFKLSTVENYSRGKQSLISLSINQKNPIEYELYKRCDDLNLTVKQSIIVSKLAKGTATKNIATELSVSHNTVMDHIKRLHDKFNVTNRVQLLTTILNSCEC